MNDFKGFMMNNNEDILMTMNTKPNTSPRKAENHYSIRIASIKEAISIKEYCRERGLAVWDNSERGVYPKFLVIPDRPGQVGLLADDLLRVYTKTYFPLREPDIDSNFPWTPEEEGNNLLKINTQLKKTTTKYFVISHIDMLELINSLGQFFDEKKFIDRFEQKDL